MISFVDPGGNIFIANLARIESGNEKTQEQISSGLKVAAPEDAPDQVSQLLGLQASLARSTQVQANLANVQTLANAADGAITGTLQLLDQASSLAAQGAGSGVSTQTRQQLADQVQSIFNQVLSLSQTAVNGRYIFSGDNDQSPSYATNPLSPNGVDRLSVALNTSQVQDSNGSLFPTGLTAGQIFDHRNPDDTLAPDNLFAALNSLYQALKSDDTAGISTAMSSLKQSADYVNAQQGFYGTLQNRLTQSLDTAASLKVSLTAQIARIRDTDLSEAAVQLTQGATQYQAALAARSKVPHTCLFDYLG